MTSEPSRVPPGVRVYAIGDIHGRSDLLDGAIDVILADARTAPEENRVIVHLGDYIDRGPNAAAVIDRLIDEPPDGFEIAHLIGNHEDTLIRFLDDVRFGPRWLGFGGMATLESYRIRRPSTGSNRERWETLRRSVREALPARHLAFLRSLRPWHRIGDYLFVHAGVRPGIPIERQDPEDLIWIREAFLDSDEDFGATVVHGHTPTRDPEFRANRINIDTGACFTGRLTCLVLHGTERRPLIVSHPLKK